MQYIYADHADPSSEHFDSPPVYADGETANKTMVDLINACLRDEMARDPRMLIFGQDIADASREEVLDSCKGKEEYLRSRMDYRVVLGLIECTIALFAEANIVGRAIGLAERGLRPVVEIQFLDYIWPAFQQIRNELATARWRSGGDWLNSCSDSSSSGGYLKGGAPYHSQSAETLFTHIPGLRVVMHPML